MALSYADLKWNEMASKINKLHKLDLSEEDIENLNYYDRCRLLNFFFFFYQVNCNQVLVARHFQYHIEVFLK